MIILSTERLKIREFTLNDAELIFQYSQDQCIKDELPDQVYDSVEAAKNFTNKLIDHYEKKSYPLVYAIVLIETDILIGHIGLSSIGSGNVEIGYAIAENFQKKGYAKEIVKPFAKWAKDFIGLEEIYGIAKTSNISSWNVLESAEFVFQSEGTKNFWGKDFLMRTYIYK